VATAINDTLLRELFSNRRKLMETLLEVENKQRQLVPFKLNPIQLDMLTNSTGRDVYVKPAQVGATTLWAADFLLDCITINGTIAVIISYDDFSAQRLLLKAKKFHTTLQQRIPSIPKLNHKSSTELSFYVPGGNWYSAFYIFSAKGYVLGRGEALHDLLLDEYAFYPEGTHAEISASVIKRVPLVAGTKIVIQSTPNGADNAFHDLYNESKDRVAIEKVIFTPHFYTWDLHPEYSMRMDSEFCLPGDDIYPLEKLTSEEMTLLERFTQKGIADFESHNKLRWRRYQIEEARSLQRKGTVTLTFSQEFPEDDESCFLHAGSPIYPIDLIESMIRESFPAPIHKSLVNQKGISADVDIWHNVEEGKGYIIGIDPGKGKTSESVAHVWTFEEGYQTKEEKEILPIMTHCATFAGWYDEDEMGDYCKLLGHYFNDAVLAPEDNLDLVAHIKDYPQLYFREDLRNGKLLRAIGWQTNTSTKPYMITELNRNIEYLNCKDIRFWSQLRNIHRDPLSKSGILVTGPEDHHMAGGIAIACRTSMPISKGYVGSSGDSGGWSESWGR
jgi:hypothetical protein